MVKKKLIFNNLIYILFFLLIIIFFFFYIGIFAYNSTFSLENIKIESNFFYSGI
jgi:hypothetical protein